MTALEANTQHPLVCLNVTRVRQDLIVENALAAALNVNQVIILNLLAVWHVMIVHLDVTLLVVPLPAQVARLAHTRVPMHKALVQLARQAPIVSREALHVTYVEPAATL
jgi:hypothetical protein